MGTSFSLSQGRKTGCRKGLMTPQLGTVAKIYMVAQDGVDMTLLGKKIKASDLFVAALENEGVEYIFALPGELDDSWVIRHSSVHQAMALYRAILLIRVWTGDYTCIDLLHALLVLTRSLKSCVGVKPLSATETSDLM